MNHFMCGSIDVHMYRLAYIDVRSCWRWQSRQTIAAHDHLTNNKNNGTTTTKTNFNLLFVFFYVSHFVIDFFLWVVTTTTQGLFEGLTNPQEIDSYTLGSMRNFQCKIFVFFFWSDRVSKLWSNFNSYSMNKN